MRRFGRRSRSVGTGRILQLERALKTLGPYSWTEADTFEAPVSDKIVSFTDKVTPGTGIRAITADHKLTQATGANQVATPTTDALLKGRVSATFTGAERYDSNSAASSWSFMHTGAGFGAIVVMVSLADASIQAIMSTGRYASGVRGVSLGYGISGVAVGRFSIRNDSAGVIASVSAAFTNGAATYGFWRYLEGAATEFSMIEKTTTITSGASAAAPSAGAPPGTLRLGGDVSADANPAKLRWAASIIWDRDPTAADLAAARAYITAKWGVT